MAQASPSLTQWAGQQLDNQGVTLQSLYGDASHRRYFRLSTAEKSLVLCDASTEKTDIPAFVEVAKYLRQQGLTVPEIYAMDNIHGYLLLSDLGNSTLQTVLTADNVDQYYQVAFDDLLKMQAGTEQAKKIVPKYDTTLLQREWVIFVNWFLTKYRQLDTEQHHEVLNKAYQLLETTFLQQPQVFVHRDYHSRNLMLQPDDTLGILDFQGAKIGPICYDLVSLIKGCYIDWPIAQVEQWALAMQPRLWQQIEAEPVSQQQFLRWLDLTGLQRHLKVLGQFARKMISEKNDSYMPDMPRVLNYVTQVCQRYPELKEFYQLLASLK